MILVTGAAGFIGMHVAQRLLAEGERVVGVDNFNAYYSPALKEARAAQLARLPNFAMRRLDVADPEALAALVRAERPHTVVHLAAQAGVRHSLTAPFEYERANVAGHLSVLEAVRQAPHPPALVYASSSSVYGDRPASGEGFKETDPVDAPASLYAATKRAGELMSGTYARLYGLRQTGLRFFTVYGPWGRPDMAYFLFAQRILAGEPLDVFGDGRQARDFTYVDDVVDGVVAAVRTPPADGAHAIYNLGGDQPVALLDMIALLEDALGRSVDKRFGPVSPGDVRATHACIDAARAALGYEPRTPLREGLRRYAEWHLETAANLGL